MPDRFAAEFARTQRGLVVAAAGCGKTELVALAVGELPDTRQLILTHTHAGVNALRRRLQRHGVPPSRYRVETIAGFSLRWAASYPSISEIPDLQPEGAQWGQVYPAALRVLGNPNVASALTTSYDGVFVDEYQDCTMSQHALVRLLGEMLPVRLVGDHFQGIFDFNERTVDFASDLGDFDLLGELDRPYRWMDSNPELGEWLLGARASLQIEEQPDFEHGPVAVYAADERVRACLDTAEARGGSIVVIRKWPPDAHRLAQRLGGSYTSMEEVECKGLLGGARRFDQATGCYRAVEVIDFAATCMTKISTHLRRPRTSFASDRIPRVRAGSRIAAAVEALKLVASTDSLASVRLALEEM
ncbi:MAG: UvrD-helicase domain-containing protein, partial [Acidimicrobiales bacterium]